MRRAAPPAAAGRQYLFVPCLASHMERFAINDVEPDALGASSYRRRLSEALGTAAVAINAYNVAPGDGLPGGLHAHMDQEEVFVVLAGEATFETLEGTVEVGRAEVIRFAPGEFQSCRNAGDEELVVLAIGAPRDSEDVRIPVACPTCGQDNVRLAFAGDGSAFVCPECDAEHVPRDCPACGHEDLRVTLGDGPGETVVVCPACESEYETPPLRD